MQFASGKLGLQRLIDTLLTLHPIFAGKLSADHNRLKMLAVAIEFEIVASEAGVNKFFDLVGMHRDSGSQFPATLEQVQGQQGDDGKTAGDHRQAE